MKGRTPGCQETSSSHDNGGNVSAMRFVHEEEYEARNLVSPTRWNGDGTSQPFRIRTFDGERES